MLCSVKTSEWIRAERYIWYVPRLGNAGHKLNLILTVKNSSETDFEYYSFLIIFPQSRWKISFVTNMILPWYVMMWWYDAKHSLWEKQWVFLVYLWWARFRLWDLLLQKQVRPSYDKKIWNNTVLGLLVYSVGNNMQFIS